MTVELHSARLHLSPMTLEDGQALRGDAAVLGGMHRLPKMVENWVADLLAGEPGELTWIISPRGNRSLSGCMGLVNAALDEGEAELSCWVAKAHRRRGYASEAMQRVIDHLFEAQGLSRLRASCYRRNRAAALGLEKCGMRRIGELVGLAGQDPAGDLLLYALERDEWQARRLGLESLS